MQYIIHGAINTKAIDRTLKVHSGSWFGLPDFGVTEAVGGLFGVSPNQQGGSNLSGRSITSPIPANQTSSLVNGSGGTATGFSGGVPNVQVSPRPTTSPQQVQGAATSNTGSGGGRDPHINPSTGVWDDNYFASQQNNVDAATNQVRNDINSGYDQYFGQLNDIMNNGLPQQQTAQTDIANSQYDQGVNSLDTQKTLGLQDLNTQRDKANTQQAKTLQDLTGNIRNLFQSGNVYLGAKGAGDSSAANQYSYALTKLGSQQRGDVTSQYAGIQNDINGRESRLGEIYNGQVKDLSSQRDQQISGISQWFAEQQNALKQAAAQGQLQKGQDLASLSSNLLNVALQNLQSVQQQAQSHKQALDEWAMNHSNDINALKSNLASVSDTNYSMPNATPVSGMPAVSGGNGNPSLFGYGNSSDKKTNIFGQPIV